MISMVETFTEIKSEKFIDNPTIMSILTDVFKVEFKRKFGTDENFDLIVNPSKGDFEIWWLKTVVEDGELVDENTEITLSKVRKIEKDFEVGEDYSEEFKIEDLGRRSIQNIRQNLKLKFKEYDAIQTVEKFKDMIGTTYSPEVKHIRRNMAILIDDQGDEILLMKEDQIRGDFYKIGYRVKGVIKSAEVINNKPVIKLSRNCNEFLEALLEEEIVEIYDGVINIKKIAREPGNKSKVTVESYDDRIDPIGICVGMNGSRIKPIVNELSGENIDIISHTENIQLLTTRCLKPAKILKVEIGETLNIFLDAEEIGKAVGRKGVNVRLTSEITGYDVNIVNNSFDEESDIYLTEFNDEIDDWIIEEFLKIGLDTAKSVLKYNVETLEDRTDLEVETIEDIIKILKSEFK